MVKIGLEILIASHLNLLKNRRVGLATHPPATLPDLTSGMDALFEAGVELAALFGPEHGFDASAADGAVVNDAVDSRTGLPVFSLYGQTNEPTAAMLENIDLLVFDMQDVGARFYTFISTLFHILRGAAKAEKPVIVLDRPNPINGRAVAGPSVQPGFESFVGVAPLPVRHGLTIGELALYFNAGFGFRADLTVIPMEGWQRSMWFDQTGLPWVPLSPGMPQLSTATVYPGMCFLEGTNLSEGRGTALPFEWAGAPWLDGYRLARELNDLALPGVRFRPVSFVPSSSKHTGQTCRGVQLHVIDRESFDPIQAGLNVIAACKANSQGEFEFLEASLEGRPSHFDRLAGSAELRQGLKAGRAVAELGERWTEDLKRFKDLRQEFLLYE